MAVADLDELEHMSPEFVDAILRSVRTIAMVGASGDPSKASNDVMAVLLAAGYEVFPVNPVTELSEIRGRRVHRTLGEIGQPIDMVDVFRPSSELYAIAEQAIAIGADVLWGQLAIQDGAAARLAEAAGLKVVMNRCPKIELARMAANAPEAD